MTSVSIALATYNGARFLGEQLESYTRQTLLPNELVVTDDCSTDTTLEILSRFAAKAPFPVRIEKNETRLGHRLNFMKAAKLCQSELVSFSDQDDVWDPEKLRNCVGPFGKDDVLMTYHNARTVTEDLQPIGMMDYSAPPLPLNPPLSLEPWKNAAWGFTTIIRRFLLDLDDLWLQSVDVYETDQKDKHDQWFFFLASCLGDVAYVNKPLALYRQHGKNSIGYHGATRLGGKISMLMHNDMKGIIAREISSGTRASLLEQAAKKLQEPYRMRASFAAGVYRKLERAYRSRHEMYMSPDFAERFQKLVNIAKSGGYAPRAKGGIGKEALIRDVIRGLFLPSKEHRQK